MKLKLHSIYDSQRVWKSVFVAVSLILVTTFIYISDKLVTDLAEQERERMQIWADATKQLTNMSATGSSADIDFLFSIIEGNNNIPVLLVDDSGEILLHRNFTLPEPIDSLMPYQISDVNTAFLKKKLSALEGSQNHIPIVIDQYTQQHLYYEDSNVLKRLAFFPYIELAVMVIFIAIVYFALISTKKAEQNRVWVGLSKETAHQLGTPISSLMAWMQMLEATGIDPETVADMNTDVRRLSVIADRFSKIGSKPEMELAFIGEAVQHGLEYMRTRISAKVNLTVNLPEDECGVMMCQSLFEWVLENLTKNAVDAMEGRGSIIVTVDGSQSRIVTIDVADTGKGIARKNFKTVFRPGFTTKKRGWGLGLTLVKRIIEEYHGGHIYVKDSEIGRGTTFRIELPKVQ